ncbi:MAG: 4-(cytidine 5'-diphospho)-2-C-methyl-D-erythritol kinase [Rhizobiaceae bacterium]|nr:4-(cytidine 5'-diphospho)-2-C-methyl-D-erythritol kinase [Rhizobiaceae bacterium]
MGGAAILVRLAAQTVLAPAKINLALHVTGRREDGYHTLSSLVAFAEDGDGLSVAPAAHDMFAASGPFAPALAGCDPADNLVLRALSLARRVAETDGQEIAPLSLSLDKRLPIASGIGGGSADAAALLRLAGLVCPGIAPDLRAAALSLGADVPMCIDGVPALVEGIGEIGWALTRFPAIDCLLVNPGAGVATPEVFRRLKRRDHAPLPPLPPGGFANPGALVAYLRETRNDLGDAAEEIAPEIAVARHELVAAGAVFARMSGSGATVFGLFEHREALMRAEGSLRAAHPRWWLCPTRLAGTAGAREPMR